MAKRTADEMTEVTYKGSELIRSASGIQKDVRAVVLKAEKLYTTEQADELVKKFLSKGVK